MPRCFRRVRQRQAALLPLFVTHTHEREQGTQDSFFFQVAAELVGASPTSRETQQATRNENHSGKLSRARPTRVAAARSRDLRSSLTAV